MGARELAEALEHNSTVRELVVFGTPATTDRAAVEEEGTDGRSREAMQKLEQVVMEMDGSGEGQTIR